MNHNDRIETIYTNDEDEYIQKTFNDKSLTFMQVEQSFEERFKRHLNYSILLSRNEYLLGINLNSDKN
jgi:hypothetical protein